MSGDAEKDVDVRGAKTQRRGEIAFCLSLCLCVSVSLPSPVFSASPSQQGTPGPPRSGLQVVVRDQDRAPAPGVEATLRARGAVIARGTAPADGVVRLADLPPGSYELSVGGDGYETVTRPVTVGRAELLTVELTVRRTRPKPPESRVPGGVPTAPPVPPEDPYPAGIPDRRTGAPEPEGAGLLAPDEKVFVPMPDRWNISLPDWDRYGDRGDYPYVGRHWWDPYNQNVLKGDYPVLGQQTFFVFTGVSDTLVEGRNLPVPTAPSSERPLSEPFFGRGEQYLPVQVIRTSFDLFRGDTAFRPIDWRLRVQPAVSVNYLNLDEIGAVNIDVRKGTTRLDAHVGFQELFGEVKLLDLSPNYDFVSLRAGIQEFSSDFRGFLGVVEQPGVRFFGTLLNGRLEYNAAAFDFLEKDTNSGFNEWERRHQQVIVANAYYQDFPTPGYTTQFSYHYNRDEESQHHDHNGFIVRPAPIGIVQPHEIRVHYVGWAGNGHVGRINISHAFYQAWGEDAFNPIAAQRTDINAQMAAAELSIDKDWLRLKGSFFWASGDDDINDDEARGFDAILDVPVFTGGPFSLWNRQGLRLTQTLTGLKSPLSLLPTLRTSKDEGQANFVNPGIAIVHGGLDVELTPKLRGFANVSYLRFADTAPIEALLFQGDIREDVGLDFGGGFQWRPPLSENFVVTGGVTAMALGGGLRDIYDREFFVAAFGTLRLQF
jgi:hypothetical protein